MMRNLAVALGVLGLFAQAFGAPPPLPKEGEPVAIDFGVPAGRIKAVHGVNNAPVRIRRPQREFRHAGIPYMRTHDTSGGWGGAHYVDIPNVFPDFEADENDAANYDFAFTDEYLKPVVAAGAKVYYRLGVTIENNQWIKNYHAHPPKDFAKWARICEHVIRHYNEGWAKGFRWGIEYWEIWNEPEGSSMWKGTREEFFELYRVAANHLKRCFPQIKVGGYGGCGYYHVDDPENTVRSFGPGAGRCKRLTDWFEAFCAYVTAPKTAAPLDFHSWHFYWNNEVKDYSRIRTHAKYVRDTLDAHGLTACESHLNEWNARVNGFAGMRSQFGAAFCADMFCLLQDSPVDLAMYYDATPTRSYCGLFELVDQETTPCYEAFVAWNELYRLGGAVKAVRPSEKLGVAAATDGHDKAFLLVNGFERLRKVRPEVSGVGTGETFTVYSLGGRNRRLRATGTWRAGEDLEMPSLGVLLVATGFRGPRQILIAGDSLLEERVGGTSYGSWGQQLAPWLAEDVVIDNLALSGRSSKSFVGDGSWAKLLARIRTNDWVIVSFGHNDVARDPNRRTDLGEFQANFERFADDVRARGGLPVFVSPTQNRRFDAQGRFVADAYVGERAAAMKAAAEAKGAEFVDLAAITARELETVGCEGSKCYYMVQRIGNYDNQHTTRWGARRFAELFVEAVRSSGLGFAAAFGGPRGGLPDVPEIRLEGEYTGHLQDVWYDGGKYIYWAHTRDLLKTDLEGRIVKRAAVEGHHAGIQVRNGRVYVAVCLMQGKTGGKTTPECRVTVCEYDAETLALVARHETDINDRSGSLTILDDGTFLVGCLRPQDIALTQVRFHHLDGDFRLIRSYVIDNAPVKLGIETLKRKGGYVYLGMYGGDKDGKPLDFDTIKLDRDYKEVWRGRLGLGVGAVEDHGRLWVGKTVGRKVGADSKKRLYTSSLIRTDKSLP